MLPGVCCGVFTSLKVLAEHGCSAARFAFMSRTPTLNYSPIDSFDYTPAKDNSLTVWRLLSTTVLSRCWAILICSAIWSSAICVLNHYTHGKLSISPTLITVFGTVLGFVMSFRTTSSIERYNDGRKYWAQIVLNCRIFSRTVWFHVPDNSSSFAAGDHTKPDEKVGHDQAEALIEKKTVVNLLEAYAVAVKHYLRGEDGIYYQDLYPLVSFLPPYYSLPATIPSASPLELRRRLTRASTSSHRSQDVPISPVSNFRASAFPRLSTIPEAHSRTANGSYTTDNTMRDEESILPARIPPVYTWKTAFPFSFFFWLWETLKTDARKTVGANGADKNIRRNASNVPLEISLFLSSYISALQVRKTVDVPTISLLYASLDQLLDALTGLERILTTPIPISYCSHLWMVTLVYCTALPFQLWSTLGWFVIPASVIASFIFFGFVVAGEEIENPFGYDRNDLDMDHFVQDIIRKELRALTAKPTPDLSTWVFSSHNNFLVTVPGGNPRSETPTDWLQKGKVEILEALQGNESSTKLAQ